MEEYLNFDEAVDFLSTTKSTLYKWLKAGKVPAHKLGRQWRFKEDELKKYIEGQGSLNKTLTELQNYLSEKRKKKMKAEHLDERSNEIAEKLIWDAVESGAYGINLQPHKEHYEVNYRGTKEKENLPTLDRAAFESLDSFFMEISNPFRGEEKRRLFLSQDIGDERVDLQIQYMAMNTVLGKRLNLKIIRSDFTATQLEKVAHGKDLEEMKKLLTHDHGVIAVTGGAGSGKTTTLYCAVQELLNRGNLVFTLEDPVNFIIDGANQIEVDMGNTEELDKAMKDIYDSDPDVVCLGLGAESNLAQQIRMASKFAESGHLVLIQLHHSNTEKAWQELAGLMEGNKKLIRGVIGQKLEKKDGGGRKAVYDFRY
ncbi:MAG: ATPase, T2SS/T4P/T4SS family [Halobacteriovoraceae bacterium]|nr:ATPase, T2SS/T4P/T4SS family [Halobacteriovoraceae bacterium]